LKSIRILLGALAMLAISLGAVACGDDDDESADSSATTTETDTASAEEVTVTAEEYSFDLSATPTTDTKEVTFDNQGQEFHVMIFARINEGFTVEEAVKMEGEGGSADLLAEAESAPGKTTTAKVKGPIEPGSYAMLCPIESKDGPHYELGQLEEFDIE